MLTVALDLQVKKEKNHEKNKGEELSFIPMVYLTRAQLYKSIPQDKDKAYLAEAVFDLVLFVLVKRRWMYEGTVEGAVGAVRFFDKGNPDREANIVNVPKLRRVDFSSLRMSRYNGATQAVIKTRRIWLLLLIACAAHYDLDFGLCARYLGGEYTAKWRDVESIPGAVTGLVSDVDLDHMRRILDHRCPAEFN